MISGRNEHRGPAYNAGTMTKEAGTEHKSTYDVVGFKSGCSYGILYRTSNEQLTFAESLVSVLGAKTCQLANKFAQVRIFVYLCTLIM